MLSRLIFCCWVVALLFSKQVNAFPASNLIFETDTLWTKSRVDKLDAIAAGCFDINWAVWPTANGKVNALNGTIDNNGDILSVTMSANYLFETTPSIYSHSSRLSGYPSPIPNATVPKTEWSIGTGGETKMCFSKKVTNPVLLLASLGSSNGTKVTLRFSIPYVVVYDGGNVTFDNSFNISGIEGYAVIMFPGEFDCVTVYSTTPENYTNITWGIKPQPFQVDITETARTCSSVTITASSGVSYQWSGGDNPTAATNTFRQSGNYTVTVTDASGCKASASKQIILGPTVTATETKKICGATTYTATGGVAYQWSGGDTPNSAVNTFHQPGIYNVIVTDNGGCQATLDVAVSVTPAPNITIMGNTTACDVVTLTASGGDTYLWSGGERPNSATNTFTQSGIYNLTVTGGQNCLAMQAVTVTVNPPIVPTLSIAASPQVPVCQGETVTYTATPQNTPTVYNLILYKNGMQVGTGLSYTSIDPANNDKLECRLNSSTPCTLPAASNVITQAVVSKPTIDLPGTIIKSGNAPIALKPVITGAVQYYTWTPALGLSDATIANPLANPLSTTSFTLNVVTASGCQATATVEVVVKYDLTIPNTFTPNGDGLNDTWNITYLNLLQDVNVDIFNRWGKRVFHSAGYAEPWNATFQGQPVPAGSYYYVIKYGLEQNVRSGFVAVLR